MSKRSASSQPEKQRKASAARMSAELARELDSLSSIADDEIDMSDMPEVLDWSGASVGKYYRPIKEPVSIRMDADVLAWLRQTGQGYQSRLNDLARCWMLACSEASRKGAKVSSKKTMESAARSYAVRITEKPKKKSAASKPKATAKRAAKGRGR